MKGPEMQGKSTQVKRTQGNSVGILKSLAHASVDISNGSATGTGAC